MPTFELLEISIYLLSGAFAGLLAGLLGVGGGLFIVPVLLFILPLVGIDSTHLMTICVATSLCTIVVTSISSIIAHQKHQAILWSVFWQFLPGIILGSLIGSYVADSISEQLLTNLFAVSVILIAFKMLFKLQLAAVNELPKTSILMLTGSFIGGLSTMIGIGGGALTVPILNYWKTPMSKAIATSSACGLPIAVAGTIGFIIIGFEQSNLPAYSSGYVYWPAVLGIIVTSVIFAPIGAKLTHKISAPLLSKIFAIFLLVVGTKVLLN
ncbi:MAG: putative membrane protein YfcA [Enterobacterales bacterium]|jgi:uncharacterized membrane protein YfcA